MEQPQDLLPTQQPDQEQEAPAEEEVLPTKSVKNFWERLDEVFVQNTELRERMEELVAQFPESQQANGPFKSFLFQPERISLSSNDDVSPSSQQPQNNPELNPSATNGHYPSEKFSNFRIRLRRPLRNVKSIQLLSGVIPNAVQNIPDNSTLFFWYKLRQVGDGVILGPQYANLGPWDVNEADYKKGDIVSYLGQNYVAVIPFEGVQPGVLYWQQTTTPVAPTIWSPLNNYIPGDYVSYVGKFWVCLVATPLTYSVAPTAVPTDFWLPITLPTDTTRPNYYDLNKEQLRYLFLAPSTYFPYEYTLAVNELLFNRTFEDYDDLVNSLNAVIAQVGQLNNDTNGISFQYNPTLNKIIMIPGAAALALGFYFMPCGYEDENVASFMVGSLAEEVNGFNGVQIDLKGQNLTAGYILNTRLGFTWNGVFTDPFILSNPWNDIQFQTSLYWYLRAKDPGYYPPGIPNPTPPPNFLPSVPDWPQNIITFNSYPDLVNTSCVRIYADFALASTQDSLGSSAPANTAVSDGLLSIVPVNASNLGVAFYQNNFNNPLTKIPENIAEIGITMLNDQGQPYFLPNSAVVLLELAVEYK